MRAESSTMITTKTETELNTHTHTHIYICVCVSEVAVEILILSNCSQYFDLFFFRRKLEAKILYVH